MTWFIMRPFCDRSCFLVDVVLAFIVEEIHDALYLLVVPGYCGDKRRYVTKNTTYDTVLEEGRRPYAFRMSYFPIICFLLVDSRSHRNYKYLSELKVPSGIHFTSAKTTTFF